MTEHSPKTGGRTTRLIVHGKSAGRPDLRAAVEALRSELHDIEVRVTWEAGDSQRMAREAVEQNLGSSAADSDDQSALVLRSPGRGIHEEDITEDHPTAFVVDDDASVRRSVARLLTWAGYAVETHASAAESLRSDSGRPRPGCIVLDLRMPELGGLDVQEEHRDRNYSLPIIFITGHEERRGGFPQQPSR